MRVHGQDLIGFLAPSTTDAETDAERLADEREKLRKVELGLRARLPAMRLALGGVCFPGTVLLGVLVEGSPEVQPRSVESADDSGAVVGDVGSNLCALDSTPTKQECEPLFRGVAAGCSPSDATRSLPPKLRQRTKPGSTRKNQ